MQDCGDNVSHSFANFVSYLIALRKNKCDEQIFSHDKNSINFSHIMQIDNIECFSIFKKKTLSNMKDP